jgi:hypothetical protein
MAKKKITWHKVRPRKLKPGYAELSKYGPGEYIGHIMGKGGKGYWYYWNAPSERAPRRSSPSKRVGVRRRVRKK